MRSCFILFTVWVFLAGCEADPILISGQLLTEMPPGFPPISYPEDNGFTTDRWLLGKKLFHDPILSRDNSISCASCHKQHLAFADDVPVSPGVEGALGKRNAPSLANVAYHPYFMREGGVATLEMQVLVPLQEHTEMDFNIVDAGNRLKEVPEYVEMSRLAYDREPDYYVITRALANYQRTLISGNSPYDQYAHRQNTRALSDEELRGLNLFFSSRTHCASCHSGFNFTDYSFQNNGLYEQYADKGRFLLTGNDADLERFKVPSLRNVVLTAPYMHDGSMQTLIQVVAHYNTGGADNPYKSDLIQPLNLSNQEQQDLVAFLHSLTDLEFTSNPMFKP